MSGSMLVCIFLLRLDYSIKCLNRRYLTVRIFYDLVNVRQIYKITVERVVSIRMQINTETSSKQILICTYQSEILERWNL